MLKYDNKQITFSEVPDEISLTYSMTSCSNSCKGCHSPWLRENIGIPLVDTLEEDLKERKKITTICFLGESLGYILAEEEWLDVIDFIRTKRPDLKIAMYSGRDELPFYAHYFDYFKLGSYQEDKGPLTSPTTNQKFYKITNGNFDDITYKFWRADENKIKR